MAYLYFPVAFRACLWVPLRTISERKNILGGPGEVHITVWHSQVQVRRSKSRESLSTYCLLLWAINESTCVMGPRVRIHITVKFTIRFNPEKNSTDSQSTSNHMEETVEEQENGRIYMCYGIHRHPARNSKWKTLQKRRDFKLWIFHRQ